MISTWGFEIANRDRVAEAEQILLAHRFARPVVKEIGSTTTTTPAGRARASLWPANLEIVSAVAAGVSGDRRSLSAVDW